MRKLIDRVGLGFRPELAAGILAHAERIDVVEVIADDHFRDSRTGLRALRTLGAQVPVVLHGVSLGLASSEPVDRRRLDGMARVVDAVRPDFWSEHLAFVRGGGIEIGHLAAPPRTAATVEGTAANLDQARKVVGSAPLLENIATLLEPPGSDRDEAQWIADTAAATGADLLLDLHNLHANATNFGFDALGFLNDIPIERVRAVHLAGGRFVTEPGGTHRLLDDHLHDVPVPVFDLLREAARRAPHALTVILERDGRYPPMADLLGELDRAREALRSGRQDPLAITVSPARRGPAGTAHIPEGVLARLYADRDACRLLRADPAAAARRLGLTPALSETLAGINGASLLLAAECYARKREARHTA